MRNLTLLFALSVAALLPGSARAADDDPATRDAKSRIEYFDRYQGKVKDDGKFGELVMDLASFPHALTVERISKILQKDGDEEHKLIASAALAEFKDPKDVRDLAGKALVKALQADFSDDVVDTCVDSIGKILYRDAVPVLNEMLLGGGNPWILLTTVRATGRLDDRRSLPALLELWERNPVGYSWETGEVKVDTGAAGTADQEAAEAQWKAKYGTKMGSGKKPPVMFKVYIQELIKTVQKITREEKMEVPNDLRAWMEARRAELKKEGIDVPRFKGGTQKDPAKDGGKDGGKGGKSGKDGGKDEAPKK